MAAPTRIEPEIVEEKLEMGSLLESQAARAIAKVDEQIEGRLP